MVTFTEQILNGKLNFLCSVHKDKKVASGPKIDPCGISKFEYKIEEQLELICTKWVWFDK